MKKIQLPPNRAHTLHGKSSSIRYLIFLLGLLTIMVGASCSEDVDPLGFDPNLTQGEQRIIRYFQEIALGFESGSASRITRKWTGEMRLFAEGTTTFQNGYSLETTVDQINELATDGFRIRMVDSQNESNCYIFFGSKGQFVERFPGTGEVIGNNFGRFDVTLENNAIVGARIFVDTQNTSPDQQQSLTIEELTQSLGLGRDAETYRTSIFYETRSNGGFATSYANIDEELIRLLYHPDMVIGLDAAGVQLLLTEILLNE